MTDTKSVYQIAQQVLDDWPHAGQVKSAHKTLLVAMIAEKLSEQRRAGYMAGRPDGRKADAPELNPWVSVKEGRHPNSVALLVTDGDDVFTADCCKGHLWNHPFGSQYGVVTHWWDESILPIPRPKEAK